MKTGRQPTKLCGFQTIDCTLKQRASFCSAMLKCPRAMTVSKPAPDWRLLERGRSCQEGPGHPPFTSTWPTLANNRDDEPVTVFGVLGLYFRDKRIHIRNEQTIIGTINQTRSFILVKMPFIFNRGCRFIAFSHSHSRLYRSRQEELEMVIFVAQ